MTNSNLSGECRMALSESVTHFFVFFTPICAPFARSFANKNPNFDTRHIGIRVLTFLPERVCKQGFSRFPAAAHSRIDIQIDRKKHLFSASLSVIFKWVIVERYVTGEFIGLIVKSQFCIIRSSYG